MFRRLFRVQTYHWASIIPLYQYRDPYDDTEPKVRKPPETGWERVRALFEYTESGYVSQEYIGTVQLAGCSFILSFVIAGGLESVKSFENFVATNQQTKFVSAYEARRKMQDYILLQGMKRGLKYGTKCCVFTFITGMVSIVIAAYRGKEGILEYTVGAGLAGAIVRLYVGLTATAVGFCVGAFLGTMIGTAIWGIGHLTGTSIRDTHQMLFSFKADKDRTYSNLMKKAQEASYQGAPLKQWLKSKMTTPEVELSDEDKRYFVKPPMTNEDDAKHENTSKENAQLSLVEPSDEKIGTIELMKSSSDK